MRLHILDKFQVIDKAQTLHSIGISYILSISCRLDKPHTMVVIPVSVFDHSTKSCLIYCTFLQILDEFQVIDRVRNLRSIRLFYILSILCRLKASFMPWLSYRSVCSITPLNHV